MILYNYRYRGPYEYDKYVNNIFQFFNETKYLEDKLLKKEYGYLQDYLNVLETTVNNLTGESCRLQQQLLLIEKVR